MQLHYNELYVHCKALNYMVSQKWTAAVLQLHYSELQVLHSNVVVLQYITSVLQLKTF